MCAFDLVGDETDSDLQTFDREIGNVTDYAYKKGVDIPFYFHAGEHPGSGNNRFTYAYCRTICL